WREIAARFKGQSDVWFDPWNEPFAGDGSDHVTPDIWLSETSALVDNIRSTGASNIITPLAGKMGSDESSIVARGRALATNRPNLLFQVHAYEAWLNDTQTTMEARVDAVLGLGLPLYFGEYADHNAVGFLDVTPLMNVLASRKLSSTAWLW